MAAEPNRQNFLVRLKSKNFSVTSLAEDAAGKTLAEIHAVFSEVNSHISNLAKATRDYRAKIDAMSATRSDKPLKDLVAERDELQRQVDKLAAETNQQLMQEKVADLEREKASKPWPTPFVTTTSAAATIFSCTSPAPTASPFATSAITPQLPKFPSIK